MSRISALGGTKDSIANFEFVVSGRCRSCQNTAGEFHAGYPWERRLVLVFALDLEDVEEVCAGGVDFNEVFVFCWGGCGQVGYFEVKGALFSYQLGVPLSKMNAGRGYTLTYSLIWMARIVYISSRQVTGYQVIVCSNHR